MGALYAHGRAEQASMLAMSMSKYASKRVESRPTLLRPVGSYLPDPGHGRLGDEVPHPQGLEIRQNDALRARGAVRLADRRVQRGCHGSGPKRDHEPRTEKPARVIHGRLMVHEATAPKNRPYRDERAASDELFTLAERGPRCRSQTATASATSTSFPQVTAMVTVAQWMEPSAVTSLTASRRGKSVLSAAPPANKVAAITAADVPHRRPIQLLWLKVRRAASLHKSPAYWPALVQPVRLLRPLASAASRELIGPKLRSPSP